jgi:hypothetical protein
MVRTGLYAAAALLAVMVLTAQSCAEERDDRSSNEVTSDKWSQIELGMTKQEVRSILGEPDEARATVTGPAYTEQWSWGVVTTRDGEVLEADYQISFGENGLVDAKYRCWRPGRTKSVGVRCNLLNPP